MIQINGAYLEGGGQIARTALAFSTLVQKAFEITDIRKGRKVPGLKNQHLYCIKSLKELCSSVVEGDKFGSTSLIYYPRKIVAKTLDIDVGTAGSVTLLLQGILMPAMFASKPITINIQGGTDVKWSTSFDYFNNVLLPQIQRFAKIEANLLKRGYYPKGQGQVEIKINPIYKINEFDSFNEFKKHINEDVNNYDLLEQFNLIQIKGISHASSDLQNGNVAERQAQAAKQELSEKYKSPINISVSYQKTASTGSGITLWAIFSKNKDDIDENNPIRVGADFLGEERKNSEDVGKEAAINLIKEIESKAAVDKHLADQILPFMALLDGSKIKVSEITDHCRTNIYAIQQFLGSVFGVYEENKIIKTNEK
jgi:RNA 3'-phosphate cyclase